jgi:hypothetical protein
VAYSITYGNRGGVAAPGVQLRDILPAGVTYVGAHPAPEEVGATLVWELGELAADGSPATIVVTATLPLTAVGFETYTNTVEIEGSSPELETWNKQAQAVTWIGAKSYLPLVMNSE